MRFTTNIPFTKEIHKDPKPLSRNTQYLLVALAPAYFLFLGLIPVSYTHLTKRIRTFHI